MRYLWPMKRTVAIVVASMVLSGLGTGRAAEPAPVASAQGTVPAAQLTARDFFRAPLLNAPVVNRAGTRLLALVDSDDDHTGALFFNMKTGKQTAIRGPGDRDIFWAYWLDDQHVLLAQSKERLYADALFVSDVDDLNHAIAVARSSAFEFIDAPIKKPMRPLVWLRQDAYDAGKDRGAIKLDATENLDKSDDPDRNILLRSVQRSVTERTGTAASIAQSYPTPPGATLGYLTDREGELAYAITMSEGKASLQILRKSGWEQSPLDLDQYDIVDAGDVADEIIAVGPRQDSRPRALLRVNAATGTVTDVLHQDDQYDPTDTFIIRHPQTRKIIGIGMSRSTRETIWFDPGRSEIQAQLKKAFPGQVVSIIGADQSEKTMVLQVFSDRSPSAYYLIDLAKQDMKRIAFNRPWIDAAAMRPMQIFQYKTRDDKKVEGYLTLPVGASKENRPPLVVLVHGGPWNRDLWGWNPEVQFLASRGYAVFQPNYRGSSSYQWRFGSGDDWEFLKMHDDVTDGVKKLVKSGLIDSERIAIMGASFGGYLALCGAAFEPEMYRCAISEAGVFDWTQMMKEAKRDQYESIRYQYYRRNLGDPRAGAEKFAAMSPLNRIADVKIPILVAHGRADRVVDVEQSKRLVQELKKYQIPHEVFFRRGEGHGFDRLENKVEYYETVEKFLATNLASAENGRGTQGAAIQQRLPVE